MLPNVFTRGVLHVVLPCLVSVALSACGTDANAPTAVSPPAIERVSGDGQTAPPGSPLDRPLVARIHDRHGKPVVSAKVWWSTDDGEISPTSTTTDANGRVTAVWQLGTSAGIHRATVYAAGVDSAEFVAYVDGNAMPDRVPLRAIDLDTYDGSGQVVHPDVAMGPFEGIDDGARLAITPYPGGNPLFENPSLYVRNGRDWSVPAGVTNPLVTPTTGGYLSDPDIVWADDVREFWLFYRQVTTVNDILVIRSSDGVRWSAPKLVVRAPNHDAVSPTVVRRAPNDWLMWTVNSGQYGCGSTTTTVELRRSTDGEAWSAPSTVSLTQAGVFPWHIDVQWIASLGEYWAVFNGKTAGSCTTGAVYFATSPDGLTWRTFQAPLLRRGAIPEFADIVYRATFAYEPKRDVVSFWHSGARYTQAGYEWRAGFERLRREDLLDKIERPDVAVRLPLSAPPLTNVTAP